MSRFAHGFPVLWFNFSSRETWGNPEISEINKPIVNPLEIPFLDANQRYQLFGFWSKNVSLTCGSPEKLPDRNLVEFVSEVASRMADLIERGGAYKYWR
jgi:hypothetical protein